MRLSKNKSVAFYKSRLNTKPFYFKNTMELLDLIHQPLNEEVKICL